MICAVTFPKYRNTYQVFLYRHILHYYMINFSYPPIVNRLRFRFGFALPGRCRHALVSRDTHLRAAGRRPWFLGDGGGVRLLDQSTAVLPLHVGRGGCSLVHVSMRVRVGVLCQRFVPSVSFTNEFMCPCLQGALRMSQRC